MTREEALSIVLQRLAAMPGVKASDEAIDKAVAQLLGEDYEEVPEPPPEKPKFNPMVTDSRGLHEKYFPDG